MSGYTPLFSSLTTGTLCGKWPDIGLWPIVLSLSDWRGVVDVTPDYLSRVTGLQLPEVIACMERFCQPDPYSRSEAEEGRRLVLLDPEKRNWGWQIVNLQIYRDRASSKDQIADGRNADKVKRYRDRHRATPGDTGGHSSTPPDTDSYSDPNIDSEQEQPRGKRSVAARGSRIQIPYEPSEELREWAKTKTPDVDVTAAAAEFADFWKGMPGQRGCKLDWEATFRNRLRELQGRSKARSNGKPKQASEWM